MTTAEDSPPTLSELATNYAAVIGFDHPTVGPHPQENVDEFLQRIPAGVELDVDILCHSRGGLVARILSGENKPIPQVRVRKIVFVGTPNEGSVIVSEDNVRHLIDPFSTLVHVLPPGPPTTLLDITDAIVEAVRGIATGTVNALPGLRCMAPIDNAWLAALNGPPTVAATHYAVTASYRPAGNLRALFEDCGQDLVFGAVSNDAAVPSLGVWTVDGDPCFPIPPDRLHEFSGSQVWHCNYFEQADTDTKLT